MIIKIKTFSGETLYIPEEDYLDEVMYSNLVNKASKNKKIREIGQKFLDVRKPTGGMEAWAKEHGVRPNLNSVGRRVNRGFDQPMTRLEKYKLDKMYSDLEEREFGTKSKLLGAFAPGAWQAKEAAKYGYDEDEYKRRRAGYALKGAFTPGVATAIKKKAEKMQKEGYSKKEIREFLEKSSGGRITAGVGEVLTGGLGGLTTLAATGSGLYDTVTENRAGKERHPRHRRN